MGQYHRVYNLDKKETMSTHKLGDGAKLLEWGLGGLYTAGIALLLSNSNGRGGGDLYVGYGEDLKTNDGNGNYTLTPKGAEIQARIKAISGRWAGDRIVVQGDYAEAGDPAYILDTEDYTDISQLVVDALVTDAYLAEKLHGGYGVLDPTPMPTFKPKAKRVRKPRKAVVA